MSFQIVGEAARHKLYGDSTGGVIQVTASNFKQAMVYATKPHTDKDRAQSLGMTPEQARNVAALLVEAADWCDANPYET